MTHTSKILSLVATICGVPTGFLHAQSVQVAQFTTSFPFHVSDQKLSAGTYTASKPDINSDGLLIRDADWSHSAFVHYSPTQSTQPIAQGEATFHQYADADYLSNITLAGEKTGMEMLESIMEKRAATALANHEGASTKSAH
jgi:hypothetical protein